MALIFDLETSGLPICPSYKNYYPIHDLQYYEPSRIVQVCMMLCNEFLEPVEIKNFIIKSDGFPIHNAFIHGITPEISSTQGVPFNTMAEQFGSWLKITNCLIAHNAGFDVNIMKSELFRYGHHEILTEMNIKQVICTMNATKWLVKAPFKKTGGGVKDPSLAEFYQYAVKKAIQNQHDAKYDVLNLHEAFKLLVDSNKVNVNIANNMFISILTDFSVYDFTFINKPSFILKKNPETNTVFIKIIRCDHKPLLLGQMSQFYNHLTCEKNINPKNIHIVGYGKSEDEEEEEEKSTLKTWKQTKFNPEIFNKEKEDEDYLESFHHVEIGIRV